MRRPPPSGFTLVEVLVALLIMALLAAMGWRGIDAMVRSRDIGHAAAERSLLLGTLLAQWEQDLQAVQPEVGVPSLSFDGSSLRLARRNDSGLQPGLQLVVWSLRQGQWQRWAGPTVTRAAELQEAWLRSQQLQGNEPQQLRLLDKVVDWQLYFYRENGWSNPQSSGAPAAPAPTPPAGGTTPPAGTPAAERLPSGVRLVIELPEGKLTRDVLLRSGA